jgi:hypothetical protein
MARISSAGLGLREQWQPFHCGSRPHHPNQTQHIHEVDVRRVLGKPNDISRHSGSYAPLPGLPPSPALTDVEVWNYTYSNVDENAANFIVGLFAGGAPSNINTFTVVYDEQGIVRHISSKQSEGRSGPGARQEWKPID